LVAGIGSWCRHLLSTGIVKIPSMARH
jgi:hypothetical protein